MDIKNLDKIINESLAIEREEAIKAGALGYMSRALIQATMPHSRVDGFEFKRKNGAFKLSILADSDTGLPYGIIPRLLLSWITTEAVRTKNRELLLGNNLSNFMSELDLIPSGGRWGNITRLKDQMKRLFSSTISCTYDDGKHWGIRKVTPVEEANLWWDPKEPNQTTLWESNLILGEKFFNEIITNPVPIDLRALKAIKRSPMAIDIYCWLTYRMSYLKKSTDIPWEVLQVQFGANYKDVSQFKRRFLDQLKKVAIVYPEAKIKTEKKYLTLSPSKSHISSKIKQINFTDHKVSGKTDQVKIEESRRNEQKYTEYKHDKIIEIVELKLSEKERHKLFLEFDDFLIRKSLKEIREKIIKGIHDKEVKENLYNFISNRWHHLLEEVLSYRNFLDLKNITTSK